ncbi:polysaccharide deacetylase family protein [Anaeromicropila herbilytica]|uniref:NodB homology domain-containing protein n=1 Tax=Anaeromicropila herbilytica TaxID=2785025 RepID=A0A7R7EJW8_9FIRM|nr:polysaccharide deacetylase family protein [Anaeromicropila herbilytica]BCN30147.1 hypothetical protein bsdtb5_14420 [Anaeromicropila herbilytica]
MKKEKKLVIAIGVMIIALLMIILTFSFILINRNKEVPLGKENKYDATNEIKAALKKIKTNEQQSKIIKDVKTVEKVVSIDFTGLSDTKTNKHIIQLLDKYHRKATFLIPGMLAAEDSNIVSEINEKGHRIGSNTLSGTKNIEDWSTEQLIKDFCLTNEILSRYTKKVPSILECNSTKYTNSVLKAAYVSGYQKVVDGTTYINYQSFSSYQEVLDYVSSMDRGSIITIKMKGTLDEGEYKEENESNKKELRKKELRKKETNNEVNKKEATSTNQVEFSNDTTTTLTEQERLVQVVEWLLKALDETNYQTVLVEELDKYKDSDFDKSFTTLRKENQGKLATVYKKVATNSNIVSFSFRGIKNESVLDHLLEYLKEKKIKATFFVTVDDMIDYPDRIMKIISYNQAIGNGGLNDKDVTKMSFNDICLSIYKCERILKERYGIDTNLYMPQLGKYNNLVREAASTLGYTIVTYSKNPITSKEQSVNRIMKYYRKGVTSGDIIYYRFDYYTNINQVIQATYEQLIQKQFYCVDIKTLLLKGILDQNRRIRANQDSVRKHDDLLKSYDYRNKSENNDNINNQGKENQKSNDKNENINGEKAWPTFSKEYLSNLRKKNHGKVNLPIRTVYTTQKALSYTFYGISNKKVLDNVMENLKKINAKATFFVTKNDLLENASLVKKIAAGGHEIGICLSISDGTDYNSITSTILGMKKLINQYCNQKPDLVRYAYEIKASNELLEAVKSTGCKYISQDISLASSSLSKNSTIDQVMQHAFNEGNITVRRGYILYFRMDYYNDPNLIGDLIQTIYKTRVQVIAYPDNMNKEDSSYHLKTLHELLNSEYVYTYPVKKENIIESLKDSIYSGHLSDMTEDEKFRYIAGRYIGTPSINTIKTLPGFTEEELSKLDKSGRFTEDKVLYLTFDDWGSDKPINQILTVLSKYQIKATFFVRTNYIEQNPNLLRSIAIEGHNIGSHTDMHLSFATSDTIIEEEEPTSVYYSLTPKEVAERKKDIINSYNKLLNIIGDVEIDGVPSLTKILRPPTLAMSKEGMEAILDTGFTYIVSGDFSTHDYEAKDAKALADEIMKGIPLKNGVRKIQNGSIIVMHMSDDKVTPRNNLDITAEALDLVIPKLLAEGYHFATLGEYLTDKKGEVFSVGE